MLVAKRPACNPWGYHLNSWQMPMRITKEIAKELSAPHPSRMESWQRHVQAAEARCQQYKKMCKAAAGLNGFKAHPDPKDMTYVYCPCKDITVCEVVNI